MAICRNCGTALQGDYCHECGQAAHDTRTPIWTAIGIFVQQTFGADGRFWITLQKLLFFPGRLTNEFLEGKQRRSLHPLRLFLIAGALALLTPDLLQAGRFEWPEAWNEAAPAGSSLSDRFWIGNERLVAWGQNPATELDQQVAFAMELNRGYLVWCLLGSLIGAVVTAKLLRPRRLFYDHVIFLLHLLSFAYLSDAIFRTVGLRTAFDGHLQTAVQAGYAVLAFRFVYATRWRIPWMAWLFDLVCGGVVFFVVHWLNAELLKVAAVVKVMPAAA